MSSAENETVSGPEKDGKNETRESESCKKQKYTMSEFVSVHRATLLQVLRENPVVEFRVDGSADAAKEARFTMDLILQHASQFPLKLRAAIANAKIFAEDGYCCDCCAYCHEIPIIFVRLVRKCVEDFLFGRDIPEEMDHYLVGFDDDGKYFEYDELDEFDDIDDFDDFEEIEEIVEIVDRLMPERWYGPDSDIDTEEEIELAIRFFPSVLESKRPLVLDADLGDLKSFNNIFFLAMSAQAVSFIPLFADLAVDLGMNVDTDFFGLAHHLLHNDTLPAKRLNGGDPVEIIEGGITRLNGEHSIKLHDKGFATLVCLKEKGFLKQVPEDDEVWHLTNIFFEPSECYWDASFIEIRLPFLLNWCTEGHINVEGSLIVRKMIHSFGRARMSGIQLYELLLEVLFSRFPHDLLGFAFHRDTFAYSYSRFGGEKVIQVMNEKIAVALARSENSKRKSNTLQSWVITAATSDAVSLDGLYTLIRFDPGKSLSGTTNSLA